ncbi:error-prone DNA polymerase [Schaalia sp. ZJ1691]|uniref:error-prone DNA polymerase n=1 Tax=Schaalia sp. ZJ1691 TaxID=2709404 RepID=UPI0013EB3DD9|nr:error-prone DNA polymerase [Schaalia sp. ZJ1691]
MRYAELHAHSAYTFLDGTLQPTDLVRGAVELGLEGLAVLDVDGMYSAIETMTAAREQGLAIVHGSELTVAMPPLALVPSIGEDGWGLPVGAEDPGTRLPILATSPLGYKALCRMMSEHVLANPGERTILHDLRELANAHEDWIVLTGTSRGPLRRALHAGGLEAARVVRDLLIECFGREHVVIESTLTPSSPRELGDSLAQLAAERHLALAATTGARGASPSSQALGDVLAATRLNMTLTEAQPHLPALRAFLRSGKEMVWIHREHPGAVETAADIAEDVAFDLRLVAPDLPLTHVPDGHTPASWLRELTYRGAHERYGSREEHPQAWRTIDHELEVIEALGFPGYFLIVKDITDFCAGRGILAQGRGSAANSAVCYSLGITAVDAVRHRLLFERFLSTGRSGPPDIDIDIEARRREEVIQYVYEKYGRECAAQVANVMSYRSRSAIRDAARALGYSPGVAAAWAQKTGGSHGATSCDNIPPLVRDIAQALHSLPRHMGIHSGGMVLTREPVSWICPVTWAATPGRTVLQWDKDSCADAGLVKFDLLGLGMLTALRLAFSALTDAGVRGHGGAPLGLHSLPPEDPRVYDLLCAADTVGVFQVESRAQMNTLPRLAPRCFYDIVIEVALIRPGPIQGHAVNPYLRRRQGREDVTYFHPLARPALEKTLGVPLFQEQLMQIAIDVAGFTPAQADQLRRAMGAKRSRERMEALRPALMKGMAARGVDGEMRERIYEQLHGFADFGFPESHAFSFAHIVYASAWLKVHYPEHFYAAILEAQPMGFYSPASLIHDARLHGIRVEGPDVNHSLVAPCVHPYHGTQPQPVGERAHRVDAHPTEVLRLGLLSIRGLSAATAKRIVDARNTDGPFTSLAQLARRAQLSARDIEKLASVGAVDCLGETRRSALWAAGALGQAHWYQPMIPGTQVGADSPVLADMTPTDRLLADMNTMGLTPADHPLSLIRPTLRARAVWRVCDVRQPARGHIVSVAGIVTHRQRPATGGGITFLSLEDESGWINVSCMPQVWKAFDRVAVDSHALIVTGRVEWADGAVSIQAESLETLPMPFAPRSRDFR